MDCDNKQLYGPYLPNLCYMSLKILNLFLELSYWKLATFSSTVGLHIFVNILDHRDVIVLFYPVHRHAVSNIVFSYHCFC